MRRYFKTIHILLIAQTLIQWFQHSDDLWLNFFNVIMVAEWSLSNSIILFSFDILTQKKKELSFLSHLSIYSFICLSLCPCILNLLHRLQSQIWDAETVTDMASGNFFNMALVSFRHVSIIF